MSKKMIRLINDKESLCYNIEGTDSKIFYKRIKSSAANILNQKYTRAGKLDTDGFGKELLDNYVTGWENIAGIDGKPIPFNKELLFDLPNPILAELISKINGSDYDDEMVVAEKKS